MMLNSSKVFLVILDLINLFLKLKTPQLHRKKNNKKTAYQY